MRRDHRKLSFVDVTVMSGGTKYLIDERFTTVIGAGSLNGVVSEGRGTVAQRTSFAKDTNSKMSQAAGVLNFATGGVGAGDPGRWWGAETRTAGLTIICKMIFTTVGAQIGWDTGQVGSIDDISAKIFSTVAFYVSPNNVVVGADAGGQTYWVAVVLRTVGGYVFVKGGIWPVWSLVFWKNNMNTATLYPTVGAISAVDVFTSDFFRVPEDLVINRLVSLLYEDMVKADGALGTSRATGPDGQPATARLWTGATWAIDTNKAKNTPTQGADMVDAGAGVFTSGTYAWVAQGTNTIANVGNELVVTYVNDATGAKEILADAADLSADLTIGAWYRLDWQSYVNAASSVGFNVYDGANTFLTTEAANALASHFQTFRSRSAAGCYLINSLMGAGEIFYIDNITLVQLTATTLYANTTDIGVADVIIDETLATVVVGSQCGMRLRVDDIAAPANQLLCYYDFTLGKVILDQLLAGVWSNLFNTTVAYAANLRLIVSAVGTAVRVYCGVAGSEALVTATVCGAGLVNNTKVSMFSTDVGNRIGAFDVRAVGTGGEYAFLNDYLP